MQRMYRRHTRESLLAAVEDSNSIADVLRGLELRVTGGSYTNIQRLLKKFEIDVSHFDGRRANRGANHKGGPRKRTAEELLVLGAPLSHTHVRHIKRAMIESGIPEVCAICGIGPKWNGRPLQLQVDHKNGRSWDNRLENVRFVCPNCHTQTETYGSKNKSLHQVV